MCYHSHHELPMEGVMMRIGYLMLACFALAATAGAKTTEFTGTGA